MMVELSWLEVVVFVLGVYFFGWIMGWYTRKKFVDDPDSPTIKRSRKFLEYIK